MRSARTWGSLLGVASAMGFAFGGDQTVWSASDVDMTVTRAQLR